MLLESPPLLVALLGTSIIYAWRQSFMLSWAVFLALMLVLGHL